MDELEKRMNDLEQSINTRQHEALIKMIDLYKDASNVFNYSICDSIDIWLNEVNDKTIIDYLKLKTEKENDKFLVKKYNEWIKQLENN